VQACRPIIEDIEGAEADAEDAAGSGPARSDNRAFLDGRLIIAVDRLDLILAGGQSAIGIEAAARQVCVLREDDPGGVEEIGREIIPTTAQALLAGTVGGRVIEAVAMLEQIEGDAIAAFGGQAIADPSAQIVVASVRRGDQGASQRDQDWPSLRCPPSRERVLDVDAVMVEEPAESLQRSRDRGVSPRGRIALEVSGLGVVAIIERWAAALRAAVAA